MSEHGSEPVISVGEKNLEAIKADQEAKTAKSILKPSTVQQNAASSGSGTGSNFKFPSSGDGSGGR